MAEVQSELEVKRTGKAKEIAKMIGSVEVLWEVQNYVLPELDPKKNIQGQADPYGRIKLEGAPMEYIGIQFTALTYARDMLASAFQDIEKGFEEPKEPRGVKPLRK